MPVVFQLVFFRVVLEFEQQLCWLCGGWNYFLRVLQGKLFPDVDEILFDGHLLGVMRLI